MDPKNIVFTKVASHVLLQINIKKIIILIVKIPFLIVKMLPLIVKILILIVKVLFLIMKMHTIIILMLIEYYYLKVAVNILLDTSIQIKWILSHHN